MSPDDQKEFEEIETNFAGFKGKFDRGLLVQTIVTLDDLKQHVQALSACLSDFSVKKVLMYIFTN